MEGNANPAPSQRGVVMTKMINARHGAQGEQRRDVDGITRHQRIAV